MALIRESGRQRNRRQCGLRGPEAVTRILDPQATHVVAHGTALLLTEDARQVGRVNADRFGNAV